MVYHIPRNPYLPWIALGVQDYVRVRCNHCVFSLQEPVHEMKPVDVFVPSLQLEKTTTRASPSHTMVWIAEDCVHITLRTTQTDSPVFLWCETGGHTWLSFVIRLM